MDSMSGGGGGGAVRLRPIQRAGGGGGGGGVLSVKTGDLIFKKVTSFCGGVVRTHRPPPCVRT